MNLEELKEFIINEIGEDTHCQMTGDTGLAPEEKQKIDETIEELREVAQAALDLIPKDTLLVEVMEVRNDLIDSFNLTDDQ